MCSSMKVTTCVFEAVYGTAEFAPLGTPTKIGAFGQKFNSTDGQATTAAETRLQEARSANVPKSMVQAGCEFNLGSRLCPGAASNRAPVP